VIVLGNATADELELHAKGVEDGEGEIEIADYCSEVDFLKTLN